MLGGKLIGLMFFAAAIQLIHADYYSSISGLENLLQLETRMIENLEIYVNAEKQRHSKLQNYFEYIEDELAKAKNNSATYFGNPLNAWKAINRQVRAWQAFYIADLNNPNMQKYMKRNEEDETTFDVRRPDANDLAGAARGIARLQRTYNLETLHLANGTIQGRKVSLEMSAADCYGLGMSLINSEDFKTGATWLLEARGRLALEKQAAIKRRELTFPYLQDNMILENLVPALWQSGNRKLALWHIKEQLTRNPHDTKALDNCQFAEQTLRNERIVTESMNRGVERQSIEEPMTITDMYEKTCRGELRQTPGEQRDLHCRYTHNEVPFCFIAPFKLEILSNDPYVAFYHEAIYENEIKNSIEAAKHKIKRSQIASDKTISLVSEIRTSKTAWLPYHENKFLAPIAQRLTDITGLSLSTAETLQVANYGIGGQYAPHYDFSKTEDYFSGTGNRILTGLFYIGHVELGGATAFPYLRLAVPPIRRGLVIWYNLHPSLEFDYRMKHAGCPVLKGSKWIINKWYHTVAQEFLRPCGLEPDGYISKGFKEFGF